MPTKQVMVDLELDINTIAQWISKLEPHELAELLIKTTIQLENNLFSTMNRYKTSYELNNFRGKFTTEKEDDRFINNTRNLLYGWINDSMDYNGEDA